MVDLVDFFPRPKDSRVVMKAPKQMPYREAVTVQDELKKWLVRRVECIRGEVDLGKAYALLLKIHSNTFFSNTSQ